MCEGRRFQVGRQQEAVDQFAFGVQQREVLLVLLHGQDQAFLRHFQEVFGKAGFQHHRPFHQRGHFVQQGVVAGQGGVQRGGAAGQPARMASRRASKLGTTLPRFAAC